MRSIRARPFPLSPVFAALSLVLLAGSAHADATAADKETARRLMATGRKDRRAGDAKGALQAFQAADAIMQVPTTGLEVARSQVDVGQLVEARDRLLSVIRVPVQDNEPKAFGEARASAQALAAELEPRIPSITIKLQGVKPGAEAKVKVTIDGVGIPAAALNAARAVDPGHHVVVAKAGTGEPAEAAIDIKERETKEVTLDVPHDPSADAPPPEEVTALPAANAPPPPPNTWRIVEYSGIGLGAAGLLLGGVTGLVAISDLSSAKKQGCMGNQCGPNASSELDSAGTMATLSTVGFVLAGVGAAGGVLGLVMARRGDSQALPPPKEAPAPATALRFYVGPTSAGLTGTF